MPNLGLDAGVPNPDLMASQAHTYRNVEWHHDQDVPAARQDHTGLAAFNLVLDFDAIERGIGRAPEAMEWFAAFELVVTPVWLYMEDLRLLRKLRG